MLRDLLRREGHTIGRKRVRTLMTRRGDRGGVSQTPHQPVRDAHQGLARYLTFYNQSRPHRALDGHTPNGVYVDNLPTRLTAA